MYKKEAVLIGAGKIGRGYMAYIFHKAGYKMTFGQTDERTGILYGIYAASRIWSWRVEQIPYRKL